MAHRGSHSLGWPAATAVVLVLGFLSSIGSVLSKGSLGGPSANLAVQMSAPAPDMQRVNADTPPLHESIVPKSPHPENFVPLERVARANVGTQQKRQPHPVISRNKPLKEPRTALIDFKTAPFPYHGPIAGTNQPFMNVSDGRQRGHRTGYGRVLWEKDTYNDRRVLLHIPAGFDSSRPGVIIVFFHGHGATLERDVLNRQQVPAQISASGINAVLVAPQFAVDAADSSPGRFWEPGGFGRFVGEAAYKLAKLSGDPASARKFSRMPVVIVAYSGGYLPAAWSVYRGGLKNRLRGVVLLDALYGEVDKFASWIASDRSKNFFVSSYTSSTRRQNAELERILAQRQISLSSVLREKNWRGSVAFLPTGPDVDHRDFVTRAWVKHPIKDVLVRLEEYRR
jgi:hypothetical protein